MEWKEPQTTLNTSAPEYTSLHKNNNVQRMPRITLSSEIISHGIVPRGICNNIAEWLMGLPCINKFYAFCTLENTFRTMLHTIECF